LRVGKGGAFMVGPGRHLASLRHWADATALGSAPWCLGSRAGP